MDLMDKELETLAEEHNEAVIAEVKEEITPEDEVVE